MAKPRYHKYYFKHFNAAGRYTHFGQLKGTIGKGKVKGVMIKGDPIFSLTANTDGLMVRFSNRHSTDNFHEGLEKHLKWADTTGLWVHVKIVTTFGKSMEVRRKGVCVCESAEGSCFDAGFVKR